MMRTRITSAAIALVAVAALLLGSGCTTSTTVTATNGPLPDTVTALGVGTGTAAPDKATVSFGVNAKAKTGPAAMESCTKATNRIVEALKKAGIEEKEIQTQQISLYPFYEGRAKKPTGYQASQSISVTTKKLDKLGEVMSAAMDVGASQVSGPRFFMSSENVARADAIAKAMEDAKSRAVAMAKASGRSLGGVVSVTEAVDSSSGYPNYDVVHGSVAYAASSLMKAPVLPGQQDQTAQISVVFKLK
jgi:uncharacterized protein YggE